MIRLGTGAVTSGALTVAAVLVLAASAGASTTGGAAAQGGAAVHGGTVFNGGTAVRGTGDVDALTLHAMPVGTVTFGRLSNGRLTARARMFGLTPGSTHNVVLVPAGQTAAIRFSPLTANGVGQAASTLQSSFTGPLPGGSRLAILRGSQGGGVARQPIAVTGRLSGAGRWPYRLTAVEAGPHWASYGPLRGRATIAYNASRQTLTVTVDASGVTPGPHAAHIHLGSCMSQGPVKYMLQDLVANRHGQIVHAVRVFTHVTMPIPAQGWYLNIHQGNSNNILSNGQPTIYFRPLLCADIRGGGASGSVSAILRSGDVVTGARGTTNGNVVLTGGEATGNGTQNDPFLYQGALSSAGGAAVSVLTPPFAGVTSATFYGPDTHSFNPSTIPSGQVRAVGSYVSSSTAGGVVNQGMIYLGPVSGPGGSWTTINVPANGAHTAGHQRACSPYKPSCFVMDTIAHSTMGNLVVGNYDLNPSFPGDLISANAFIYNMTTRQWTLLRLGGSLSSQTTLYGIWQDGGSGSPNYTLVGGSAASGRKRAFLMNYNEQTGAFGTPQYYSNGNDPALVTHFEGITAVPGGFHLVAMSSGHSPSMAFIPFNARTGSFGPATWYPVNVAASSLCSAGCGLVTGNTVYQNQVMGLYLPAGASLPGTYLATVPGR